jgi:hypothetical protein
MQYADDIDDPEFGLLRHMDTDRWEGTAARFADTTIDVTVQGDADGPAMPFRELFVSFRDAVAFAHMPKKSYLLTSPLSVFG